MRINHIHQRAALLCITEAPYLPADAISNVTVIENNRVTLPCPVRGTPRPEVKWYRGDSPMRGHRVTSEGSLVLVRPSAEDTAQYRCEATNVAGNLSHVVDLLVFRTLYATHNDISCLCLNTGSPAL